LIPPADVTAAFMLAALATLSATRGKPSRMESGLQQSVISAR
jgi:hypothetical protein